MFDLPRNRIALRLDFRKYRSKTRRGFPAPSPLQVVEDGRNTKQFAPTLPLNSRLSEYHQLEFAFEPDIYHSDIVGRKHQFFQI